MDAAPLAGVVFLLVIFMLLHSSLVFTPGVRISLGDTADMMPNAARAKRLRIDRRERFSYDDKTLTEKEFIDQVRADHGKARAPESLIVQADPAVENRVLERVRDVARELSIQVEMPGIRVELPELAGLSGTSRPTLVVAVNLNGQIFFENQIILEKDLKKRLAAAARQAKGPLALALYADKAVEYDLILRLSQLARAAGIAEIILAARPPILPLLTNRPPF